MLRNWFKPFQIAAVYVGTVVGAGFATGKEIVEFFTKFGLLGTIGVGISAGLFIFLGTKMMIISSRIGASSYEELNEYLFGRVAAKIVNSFMFVMLLGVTAVMLSGAGAIFEEQLHIQKEIGVFLTIGLSLFVMLLGTRGLFSVNTFVVPMMIMFSLLLLWHSMNVEGLHVQFEFKWTWEAIVSPFSYAAFNLMLAQAVLVPVATEIHDEKIIKWGGVLGGVFLSLILLSCHLTLLNIPHVETFNIPTAEAMKRYATGLYTLFIFVIYGEIFTSVIGNTYGLEKKISSAFQLKSIYIISIIFFIAFWMSKFEYGSMLSLIYPLFGYISMFFMILLACKKIPE